MKSLLLPHEWLAVLLVCMTVLGLTLFSWNHYSDSLPIPLDEEWVEESEKIQVSIEGEVEHPGFYSLAKNSTFKVLLDLAKPTSTADLRGLKKRQKLQDGQHVLVPVKKPAKR